MCSREPNGIHDDDNDDNNDDNNNINYNYNNNCSCSFQNKIIANCTGYTIY